MALQAPVDRLDLILEVCGLVGDDQFSDFLRSQLRAGRGGNLVCRLADQRFKLPSVTFVLLISDMITHVSGT